MTTILAYADRFTARPGETIAIKASVEGADTFDCHIMRLTGPEAGPLGPKTAHEPLTHPANGSYPARVQAIHAGSFAVVAPHPLLDRLSAVTVQAFIWATTPAKGRQAIAGCWSEPEGHGFLLGLDELGRLEGRVGDGTGGIVTVRLDTPVPERRWLLVALTVDPAAATLTVRQWPVAEPRFDPEVPREASAACTVSAKSTGLPFLLAAWSEGEDARLTAWRHTRTGGHFNGKIDRPRLANRALGAAGIRALAGDTIPPELVADTVGAWDFARDIPTEIVRDVSANRLGGVTVNLPARAMTGHNWTGEATAWPEKPEHYGAIHFHDDDLVDCVWEDDVIFEVPGDLSSGIFCARLTANEATFDVAFVVSPPVGQARAKVAFLASSATYTVYLNNRARFTSPMTHLYHGRMTVMDPVDELMFHHPAIGISTYDRHADGSGVCYASRHRPATNIRPSGRLWNFHCDLFILHWLETIGEPYDVITDDDLHTHGLDLLRNYSVVLTGTHPEYDSRDMLDALDGYLRIGGRFMYMGGNGFYWRIAYHPDRPGVIEVRRAEGGVRAWIAEPGEAHHSFTGEHGGLWRRQGRAPNALAGVGFISQGFDDCSYYRRMADADDPRAAFAFEGIPDTIIGDFGVLQGGAAGLEIDSADPKLGTPPHALILARSENHSNTYELVPEEVAIPHGALNAVQNEQVHADMVFFETPEGGAVWSSGSIAYAGSLSWNGYDNNVARLTTNVLKRFIDPASFAMP
ncbi:MAG: N,N-dimethylformamidase [Alphaproteobacteria bacterium]|nr:N,N-dimethylformamidase [Alphaproteobacteria bacterium]